MSKPTKLQSVTLDNNATVKLNKYTHTALGMCRNPDNKWVVVKVQYNPETMEAGDITFLLDDGTKMSTETQFKIETVHNVFSPAYKE